MTKPELSRWITEQADLFISKWNSISQIKIQSINHHFDLHGKTAGYFCRRNARQFFRWNLDIAYNNQDEYIQTIGHEVAHLIARTIDRQNNERSKPHGALWQTVMRSLGLEPKRCHNYKFDLARKVDRPIKCKCSNCGNKANLTLTKYKNMLKTLKPSGETGYTCSNCSQPVNVLKDCEYIKNDKA